MRPTIQKYFLKNKKNLTKNVYELEFEWENEINVIPWQFITFMIEWIWARAYSILEKDWKNLKFIIKKIELEEWWRWWSKYLCEMEVWAELKGIWASWNFVFRENNLNKVFFATWTWFVPIFFQIKNALQKGFSWKIKFVFWVRFEKDLFYLEELENLKNIYKNFDFTIYLSREESKIHKNWYISDEIKYLKNDFEEAYICWNPEVVNSVKKILLKNDFDERNIFDEKY